MEGKKHFFLKLITQRESADSDKDSVKIHKIRCSNTLGRYTSCTNTPNLNALHELLAMSNLQKQQRKQDTIFEPANGWVPK